MTYTNFLYVQLITDFIKHVIKEKTDIITTGESSAFVLMACANTDVIDKVILINPVSLIKLAKVPTKRTKLLQQLINAPIIGTLLYNILISRSSLSNLFRSDYYYDPQKVLEHDIDIYFESAHINNTGSKYLFASMISRYINANILFCLKNLNNSIFILTGSGNPENITHAETYQNQLSSIEIIEIENTKHLPHMECPEKILEQIRILFDIDQIEKDQ